ncbi:MAG: right-handed parallel beta-helix repeat-containing protein [Bryobacterales bacterium]|nr:right-handed parallel beta-helix repeat-containing protein [Bryobacterales bacterium]
MQFDFAKSLFALPLLAACLVAQPSGLRSIASPTTIDQPGAYILTSDIFIPGSAGVGIAVTASDVTLDLNGHTITAPGNLTGAGIRIANAQNVTVRNGNIVNALMGAVVMNSVNVRLEGLSIRATGLPASAPPPEMGIMLVQTRNSVVANNMIYNAALGIFVRGGRSFGNRIEANTITGTSMGAFGICYNPADGDPQAPKGDLVTRNFIRGYPAAIQISSRADYNVIAGNTLLFTMEGLLNENSTNVAKDNTLVKLQ